MDRVSEHGSDDASPSPPSHPSSPYATGGGGTSFEHRVGALCLARLLSSTWMSELGSRAPTRVAFQQAPTSAVDDVVLVTDAKDGAPSIRLAIACRRRPTFTRSHSPTKELFNSLVRADVAAERSLEVDERIAIAVSGYQRGAREVAELAGLARNQSESDALFTLDTRARYP